MIATKKPIEVEFYPCEKQYLDKILVWNSKKRPIYEEEIGTNQLRLKITTLEGIHSASNEDVIIKGINGEVYPCKKEIFNKTYNILTQ